MLEIFSTAFLPHGHCYFWQPGVLWLNAISDGVIALAYYSIPIVLVQFVKKRRDLPFKWVFLLFGAFILACGTTHVLSILTIWQPVYWLEGLVKGVTATVSLVTAYLLWPLLPKALAIPDSRALAESEERFRLLLENTKEYAIYMLGVDGTIISWNAGAARLKGYAAEEVIGRNFALFYQEDQRLAKQPSRNLAEALKHGSFKQQDWRLRKDGSKFWSEVVLAPIFDGQGKHRGFSKVTRDLSEQKLADETREHLLRERAAHEEAKRVEIELLRADKMKDEFLATLSHELRTPLNAILGFAQLLSIEDAGSEEFFQAVDAIQRNAQAQAHIIDDLLDVSSIVNGTMRLERAPLDLGSLVDEAIDTVRFAAQSKQMTIEATLTTTATQMIGDGPRLRQVLWNLLINAIKFTPREGRISIAVRRVKSTIELQVSDNGKGIASGFLPYIFDRFRQEDSSYTRSFGGFGLGLAITRHIVEQHGGTISVHSPGLGLGSTFTVLLPVLAIVTEQSPQHLPGEVQPGLPLASASSRLAGVRLLVVDDNRDALRILKRGLNREGAEVETADSVAEAVSSLKQKIPAVMISDIGMAGEDGLSLMRKVKRFEIEHGVIIPSIAFTAHVRAEEKSEALGAGFAVHLGKPAHIEEIIQAIVRLVASTQADRP